MLEADENIHIPKIIHAIWAGGDRGLPKDGMHNLANWAQLNPGFKITLWVDDQTSPEDISTLERKYKEQFVDAYKKLDSEYDSDETADLLEIRTIREEEICAQYGEGDDVDYAIDRLDPNYGLSSDILRYRILYKYGGCYIDGTDVTPGMDRVNFLEKLPFATFGKVHDHHKLYIDHLSQQTAPSAEQLSSFSLSPWSFSNPPEMPEGIVADDINEDKLGQATIGNDSFICTKGNPVVLNFLKETETRLRPSKLEAQVAMAYGGFNVKDRTIELSGPNMVKTILLDEDRGALTKKSTNTGKVFYTKYGSYILPLKHTNYQMIRPPAHMRNTRHWNNVGIQTGSVTRLEEACEKIIGIARYEIENMRVLRLEDYLKTLDETAKELDTPAETIKEAHAFLLKRITELPLSKVVVAQSISTNSIIDSFYESNGLGNKNFLNITDNDVRTQSIMLQIWAHVTSYGLFMGTEDYQPEKLGRETTDTIEENLKPLEIVDVFQRLERGANFIEKISENLSKYPLYKFFYDVPKFREQNLTNLVSRYADVLDVYAEAFISQEVEPQATNQLGRQLLSLSRRLEIAAPLPGRLLEIVGKYDAKGNVDLAFRKAASQGNLKDVKYLSIYAEINGCGPASGKTALHQAIVGGHEEVANWLIVVGADKTIKDSKENTADYYSGHADTGLRR